MNDKPEPDAMLIQLLASLQSTAMVQMGKIINPLSGKVERDLRAAQHSIDLLSMLQRKMVGNLTEDEGRYLDHVLFELRMNFVEEKNRPADNSDKGSDNGSDNAPAEADQTTTESTTGSEDKERHVSGDSDSDSSDSGNNKSSD